jgi:hypothetical protein
METKKTTSDCPFCKEEIKSDAIKCKHCGSKLNASKPKHEGTCPYCKEDIHTEAIKCKHCKSNLSIKSNCKCGNNQENHSIQAMRIGKRTPGFTIGDYENCYLDCSFDYPTDSLAQNVCFNACDRRWKYPLPFMGSFGFAHR